MSIIIGIDHGYYAIKTAHCSFPAGLTSYGEHEPYTRQGLLELDGCFFVCGSGRQPIQRDKTINDNYYLLTLAAIAKEIRQRGLPPECSVRIAAGLPLTSFGRDKPKFKDYLLRSNQPVNYKFEGVEYSITIEEVAIFPQGYAALMTETGLLQDEPSMLLMDLGGWTVDLMRIDNAIPVADTAHSFWEKSETALLQALMLYLLHEAPPEEQNFSMVMEMIAAAEVHEDDDNYQSPLDILFERLEMRDPDSIACKQYRIFKQAAGKTAKSILVSVGVRLAAFNLPSIAKLTMTDELHLQELGERKIALFCCIPDSDKSLNYLVGMIYTQLIQTLYRQADRVHKGRLPVPVHCLMDEYANISLPKDTFLSALATMRSRAIFCSIIVQNMAQLKAMYKDDWESLVGLCDEFLYLGGTEKETHKYVSELLGKETISTTSYNQSKGRSGSYSINHQQSGRDLMTPDEVRLLDNSKCILFIRGERPVIDLKYNLLKHPNIRYTEDGGAAPYDYTAADNARDDLPGAPENYELLDMDDFLPAEAAEMKPTIQRIRRST